MLQYLPLWGGGYEFSESSLRNSIKNLSAFTFHNSAEAVEVTTITDNSIQRGHTVSVISVEASTVLGRLGEVLWGIFLFILAVIAIVFFFSGGWLIILIGLLVWGVISYVLFGK